MGCLWRV